MLVLLTVLALSPAACPSQTAVARELMAEEMAGPFPLLTAPESSSELMVEPMAEAVAEVTPVLAAVATVELSSEEAKVLAVLVSWLGWAVMEFRSEACVWTPDLDASVSAAALAAYASKDVRSDEQVELLEPLDPEQVLPELRRPAVAPMVWYADETLEVEKAEDSSEDMLELSWLSSMTGAVTLACRW